MQLLAVIGLAAVISMPTLASSQSSNTNPSASQVTGSVSDIGPNVGSVALMELNERAELSYWQNWAITGSTVLNSVSGFIIAVTGLITARALLSSQCGLTTVYVVQSRDEHTAYANATSLSNSLTQLGWNASDAIWYSSKYNDTLYLDGSIYNGDVELSNLWFNATHLSAMISQRDNSTAIDKRTSWKKSEMGIFFHSEGSCSTALSKSDINRAATAFVNSMATHEYECACFTLSGGGGWYGDVKLLRVTTSDAVVTKCLSMQCTKYS